MRRAACLAQAALLIGHGWRSLHGRHRRAVVAGVRHKTRRRLSIVAIGAALTLPHTLACAGGPSTPAETQAVKAAEAWLKLTDGSQYGASWSEAASLFRNAVARSTWEQQIRGVRVPLGKLGSRTVKSVTSKTSLPGAPDGEYVIIQFATSFANKKAAIETVTPMKDSDGTWRVSGYYIK